MTKQELLDAIADAPDDAPVFIDTNDGILRSFVEAEFSGEEIVLTFYSAAEVEED